jgi:succinyl-diaminopimelate desuccinylase
VTEVELHGPPGSPVLGLLVHGDVQPPGDSGWTTPPFECSSGDGYIYGRGVADDKGPLVQALLAMVTLRDDPRARTHTLRLLVGSDEESSNQDISTYLKTHHAPDVTLVLDSEFPVVVGEKAWDSLELTVSTPYDARGTSAAPWELVHVDAGVSPSIVPRQAIAPLRWTPRDRAEFPDALKHLCPDAIPEGYRCESSVTAEEAVLTITGRASHSGMNLDGGRNALVFLANALQGKLQNSAAADLLEFAAFVGKDLHGASPGWASKILVGTKGVTSRC